MDTPRRDALDQLEYEDVALCRLLRAIRERKNDDRTHGAALKVFVERLAVRQSARELVADALARVPELVTIAARFDLDPAAHRSMLDRLDEMTRGLGPNAVGQGQNVDRVVDEVAVRLLPEIDVELTQLIPVVRRHLDERRLRRVLPLASYVLRHCPLHPGAHARRWYDRLGPLVWVHAVYDYLRSLPVGGFKPRSPITIPGEGELTFEAVTRDAQAAIGAAQERWARSGGRPLTGAATGAP